MYSIKFPKDLIVSSQLIDSELLLPHEYVVEDRLHHLEKYLRSLKPYIIIPSIIVCAESLMIIDGHHRIHALTNLGFESVPVTFVNYQSDVIVVDLDNKVTKADLISAARQRKLLPPKTSFHHIRDEDFNYQPMILASTLFKLDASE